MYCPKCGCVIEDEHHNFCPSCGETLSNDFSDSFLHHHTPHIPYKRTTPRWFYFLLLTTLCLMTWGIYSLFNSAHPLETIVKSQLSEIQERQVTKAYYEYTSSEFKKNTSFDDFRKILNQFPALKLHDSVEITKKDQETNYGVVYANVISSKRPSLSLKYEFIREDGEWRILKIQIDEGTLGGEDNIDKALPVIKNHLTALSHDNIEEAYNSLGSTEFKKATTLDAFKRFVKAFPLLQEFDTIDFPHQEGDGNKALVTTLLHDETRTLPIEYILIKEGNDWKVWSMRIITTPSDSQSGDVDDSTELLPPVEQLLDSLEEGNLKEAYESTASGFKAVTTFETFQSFIKSFPIFSDNTHVVSKQFFDNGTGKLQVKLSDKNQSMMIEYTLQKEDGTWKVLGMQILEDLKNIPQPKGKDNEFDTSFLTDVIDEQLQTIKEKDFYNAYSDYTSKKFREATSFDQFVKFLNQNTIFADTVSTEYGELLLNNNIATIDGSLTTADGDMTTVEYSLVKEDGEWKILGIKILNKS